MTSKHQFLDPICACSRIILLCFESIGTKIRIHEHKIQLIPPTYWEAWIGRKIYQDSREDISVLSRIIIRFIELYLLSPKKSYDFNNHLITFSEYIIQGLQVLQQTYGDNNAVYASQYYCLLLSNAINNTYTKNLLPPHLIDVLNNNLLDIDKIKSLWKDDDIVKLCEHFKSSFNCKMVNDKINLKASLSAIECILDQHENQINELIEATNKA